MIAARLVRETVAFVVRVLRCTATAREPESQLREHRDGVRIDGVARIRERGRRRDAVRGALSVDRLDLLLDSGQIGLGQAHVVPRVIANLEPITVEFGDLLPREVVVLVRPEGESFGDEEGRAKPVFFQQRTDDGVVAGLRVVEGQHDEL